MRQPTPLKQKSRPRFWLSLLLIFLVFFLAGTGNWDLVLAVLIGLVVGNGLSFLMKLD